MPGVGESGDGGLRSTWGGGGGGRGSGGAASSDSIRGGGGGGGGKSSSSCSSSGGGGRAGGSSLLLGVSDGSCWEVANESDGRTVWEWTSSHKGELDWGLLERTGDCGFEDSSGTGVSAGCGVLREDDTGGGGNGGPLFHSCTGGGR